MYLRVFLLLLLSIYKFFFIRLSNIYLLRNILKKILEITTDTVTRDIDKDEDEDLELLSLDF